MWITLQQTNAGSLVKGAKIKAKWRGVSTFYPGEIQAVNSDGTFAVRYDDGGEESSVKAENIELIAAGPAAAVGSVAEPFSIKKLVASGLFQGGRTVAELRRLTTDTGAAPAWCVPRPPRALWRRPSRRTGSQTSWPSTERLMRHAATNMSCT